MKTKTTRGNFLAAVTMLLAASAFHAMAEEAGVKKLVMIAGNPSHPAGMHGFNAAAVVICAEGVEPTVTAGDMAANLDVK